MPCRPHSINALSWVMDPKNIPPAALCYRKRDRQRSTESGLSRLSAMMDS